MKTILNYHNTKIELEIAKQRFDILFNKKTKLHDKYFSVTSKAKPVTIKQTANEKMTNYMIELTKINSKTGLSLDQELKETAKQVFELESIVKEMTENLIKLHGIEYELYLQLLNKENQTVSKAVEKTADVCGVSLQTIWTKYYPKIREIIKK